MPFEKTQINQHAQELLSARQYMAKYGFKPDAEYISCAKGCFLHVLLAVNGGRYPSEYSRELLKSFLVRRFGSPLDGDQDNQYSEVSVFSYPYLFRHQITTEIALEMFDQAIAAAL